MRVTKGIQSMSRASKSKINGESRNQLRGCAILGETFRCETFDRNAVLYLHLLADARQPVAQIVEGHLAASHTSS